eukprot:gnl/TRDRNA2_/TRDRNA2_118306_c0_seq1.p1 gnl/TRDRNA2_/TRDRNA2_118306_c0~~gnl/TRDRNA2_/TRDRNA2_118306_c0_seq1.p1  ORF type:complete len:184 (-),score=41.44 gnl/TRDRNA2_/TRDRNA2_118306_c0_seq1:391-900(-)
MAFADQNMEKLIDVCIHNRSRICCPDAGDTLEEKTRKARVGKRRVCVDVHVDLDRNEILMVTVIDESEIKVLMERMMMESMMKSETESRTRKLCMVALERKLHKMKQINDPSRQICCMLQGQLMHSYLVIEPSGGLPLHPEEIEAWRRSRAAAGKPYQTNITQETFLLK